MSTYSSAIHERLTLERWSALDDDVKGELVDGALVEEEVPSTVHEILVAWLVALLQGWRPSKRVLVLASGLRLAVSSSRGRIPDVVVYLADSPRPPAWGASKVPPSIVAEIVSATATGARRDRVDKLIEYAAFGVKWYWLVDPELRSFEILELGPHGRYVHAVAMTNGRLDAVPGCPGLTLDVDAAWVEVDAFLCDCET